MASRFKGIFYISLHKSGPLEGKIALLKLCILNFLMPFFTGRLSDVFKNFPVTTFQKEVNFLRFLFLTKQNQNSVQNLMCIFMLYPGQFILIESVAEA